MLATFGRSYDATFVQPVDESCNRFQFRSRRLPLIAWKITQSDGVLPSMLSDLATLQFPGSNHRRFYALPFQAELLPASFILRSLMSKTDAMLAPGDMEFVDW